MAKKKKKRRLRAEIKMYVVLFSLLASMITMMCIHKPSTTPSNTPSNPDQGEVQGGTTNTSSNIVVVLDPGHGGSDAGCSYETIYEKDMNLAIAKLTGEYLAKKDIEVVYTRESDIALSEIVVNDLQIRIDLAMEANAAYFVSFHMNESPSLERSNGFEVFVNDTSDKAIYLANQVSDSLDALQYTQRRSILSGSGLHVIAFNPIPSILIEMGFMSDDEDRTYITSKEGQQRIAIAIGDAIIASLENDKNT